MKQFQICLVDVKATNNTFNLCLEKYNSEFYKLWLELKGIEKVDS